MISYPPRLDLAQRPTPLQPLRRFCAKHDLPLIWIKRDDLTGSVTGGNKIRKLEFTLAAAQAAAADVLITCGGLQSNHCRATALLGAQLGLKVHLVLRGEQPASNDGVAGGGNYLLDQLAGAEISCYPAREYQQGLDAIFAQLVAQYAAAGLKAFTIPTGASDAIGVWGYVAACAELKADFAKAGINPAHIVHATGSGGTQAGLTAGAALYLPGVSVSGVNVCDDEAWFLAKVTSDLRDWYASYEDLLGAAMPALDDLSIQVIDGYVGAGYAKADAGVLTVIAELAQAEGIVLDPVYTAKAFNGLLSELRAGRLGQGDVVFIHTGGVFGLFPFQAQFAAL